MTREEFERKSFDECMEQLYEERYDITTLDTLKEFIKEKSTTTISMLQLIYAMQFGMIRIYQ